MLYATTKDVLISIVILMKGAFAHAEAKEAKAHRTESRCPRNPAEITGKRDFGKMLLRL